MPKKDPIAQLVIVKNKAGKFVLIAMSLKETTDREVLDSPEELADLVLDLCLECEWEQLSP